MFFLTSSEGDRRKDLRLFDFISPLRRTSVACSGRILSEGTLTSKLVLEVQTPAPCTYYVSAEFRLAVESYYMIHFCLRPNLQLSRAVTHKV